MSKEKTIALFCLIIATLVLFSSMHVSQLFGAAFVALQDEKKISHDDSSSLIKVATADLHHHMDKTGSQLIKDTGDQQYSADSRTLRLMQDHKKATSMRNRLSAKLRDLWLTSATYLS